MIKFKDNFYFGSASSATQSEGAWNKRNGKGKNIWDYWFETESFRFHNGVGPQDTSTFIRTIKVIFNF